MRHGLHRLLLAGALALGAGDPVPALAPGGGAVRAAAAQGRAVYYPAPGEGWERRRPAQVGMDSARLREAVEFAVASESRAPRDLALAHYRTFGREPFGEAAGPFRERGDPTGIVVRNGYIVAEWGDPHRVDMTFSVTKSFLSTVVGVAVGRGLIRSVDDRVAEYVGPVLALEDDARADAPGRVGRSPFLEPFASAHNRTVTWNTLLRQTSDWEGTLWGKPDWADRPAQNPAEWLTRPRNAPGTVYEYNDVRVNALALAALEVWRRPLPEVLREEVMDPSERRTPGAGTAMGTRGWCWTGGRCSR